MTTEAKSHNWRSYELIAASNMVDRIYRDRKRIRDMKEVLKILEACQGERLDRAIELVQRWAE